MNKVNCSGISNSFMVIVNDLGIIFQPSKNCYEVQ